VWAHQQKEQRGLSPMLGNIYDCKGGVQADQFAKTMKEVSNYVG
jgi:hypothetical protein